MTTALSASRRTLDTTIAAVVRVKAAVAAAAEEALLG
jgi:hypothetical protein